MRTRPLTENSRRSSGAGRAASRGARTLPPQGPLPYAACTTAAAQPESSKSGRQKSSGNVLAALRFVPLEMISSVPSARRMRTLKSRPAGEPAPLVVRTAKTLRVGSSAVWKRRACCHSFSAPVVSPIRRPLTHSR